MKVGQSARHGQPETHRPRQAGTVVAPRYGAKISSDMDGSTPDPLSITSKRTDVEAERGLR